MRQVNIDLSALMLMQSFIGLALSLGKSTQSGHDDYGTVWGANVNHTSAKAVWNVFTALGDAVFSFNLAPIVIEITNTLAQPPSEAKSMKRAVRIGVSISVSDKQAAASTGSSVNSSGFRE